jgi:hypothetical protein
LTLNAGTPSSVVTHPICSQTVRTLIVAHVQQSVCARPRSVFRSAAIGATITRVRSEPWLESDPALAPIVDELRNREPIFHRGPGLNEIERQLPSDYWEVGASGRRHSREYVLDVLRERFAHPTDDAWETSQFACREVGPDTYLLTYTLRQANRVTRRATVWRAEWKILYHQGTVVTG